MSRRGDIVLVLVVVLVLESDLFHGLVRPRISVAEKKSALRLINLRAAFEDEDDDEGRERLPSCYDSRFLAPKFLGPSRPTCAAPGT
jgi:hypothetical protein